MKTVTIQRSKWQRGQRDLATSLWTSDEQSGCCLGHVLHQAHGVSYKAMNDIAAPENLATETSSRNPLVVKGDDPSWLDFINSPFTEKAIVINDNTRISDKMREYRLRLLFKRHKYELKFID